MSDEGYGVFYLAAAVVGFIAGFMKTINRKLGN